MWAFVGEIFPIDQLVAGKPEFGFGERETNYAWNPGHVDYAEVPLPVASRSKDASSSSPTPTLVSAESSSPEASASPDQDDPAISPDHDSASLPPPSRNRTATAEQDDDEPTPRRQRLSSTMTSVSKQAMTATSDQDDEEPLPTSATTPIKDEIIEIKREIEDEMTASATPAATAAALAKQHRASKTSAPAAGRYRDVVDLSADDDEIVPPLPVSKKANKEKIVDDGDFEFERKALKLDRDYEMRLLEIEKRERAASRKRM